MRKSESLYNSVKLHKSKQIGELFNSGVFGKQKSQEDWEHGSSSTPKARDFKKKRNTRSSLLKPSATKKFSIFTEDKMSEVESDLRESGKKNSSEVTELMIEEVKESPQPSASRIAPLRLKESRSSPRRSSGFLSPTSPQLERFNDYNFRDFSSQQEEESEGTQESDWERQRTFLMEVLKNAKKPDFK